MKRILLSIFCTAVVWAASAQGVLVGMTDTAAYFPRLRGQRVAVLANHTAVADPAAFGPQAAKEGWLQKDGCAVHLVDLLHDAGFDVRGIFAPEHGFRGTADAGEAIRNGVDAATGIPILSLYDGRQQRPSDEAMRSFDVLVVDMQDVGTRFYTYYISMIRMMDACAEFGCRVIVLDRPNPNGQTVDGPVLDMRYRSGVGWLPVPVLHGMTLGELARMAVGEGWTALRAVEVVPCRRYTHATPYMLPVAPSPNLPTQRSVYLYPSLCLFEGTVMSVGRGTDKPFEVYGHPDLPDADFCFTPCAGTGAKHPPYEGRCCRGVDLSGMPDSMARMQGLNLDYLIEAYHALGMGDRFFTPMFEKLIGVDYVRRMIMEGRSAEEIQAVWQPGLKRFRRQREPYLLYD